MSVMCIFFSKHIKIKMSSGITKKSRVLRSTNYVYPKLREAKAIAKKLNLPEPYSSYRPGKKLYVVYNSHHIHFGARGMEDFLIHKDPVRRERYRKRHSAIRLKNGKLAYMDKNQPAYYAYRILW